MEENESLDQVIEFEGEWKGGFSFEDNGYDSGKFDMAVNLRPNGAFSGTTKDKHGIANVEGEIRNSHIKFTKKYVKDNCSSDALKAGIIYEGERVGEGVFKGLWCPEWAYGHEPKTELHYEFTLSEKSAEH